MRTRCILCNGAKIVRGLGCIERECLNCDGLGYTEEPVVIRDEPEYIDEVEEEVEEVAAPSKLKVHIKTSSSSKKGSFK